MFVHLVGHDNLSSLLSQFEFNSSPNVVSQNITLVYKAGRTDDTLMWAYLGKAQFYRFFE